MNIFNRFFFILLVQIVVFIPYLLLSADNEECFGCHSVHTMTMQKGRIRISLFVDNAKFIKSAHSKVKCVDTIKGSTL